MIRTRLTYTALTLAVLGALVGAAACGRADDAVQTKTENRNPRIGAVEVWPDDLSTSKRCDGTTLVYTRDAGSSGSIAVVPSSPECTP
jgi:hypothetical protein